MRWLVVFLLVCAARSASAVAPAVEMRVGGSSWSRSTVATPLAGERVELRVAAAPGATVRWYELLPDLDKDYRNAEWPWNPGAYRWLGYERVPIRRVAIPAWNDRASRVEHEVGARQHARIRATGGSD